jgi:Double zinc ribbon
MNRFWKEVGIIPKAAWIVGVSIYLCLTIPLFVFVIPKDHELGKWPVAGQAAFAFGLCFLIIPYIALIGYVFADARRRAMRYVMWTLLSVFIPDAIGIILYFILRDPMPKPCPGCSTPVKAGFTFCPHCGTSLSPTCTNCGRAVEFGWTNCPHCGTKLPSSSHRAA